LLSRLLSEIKSSLENIAGRLDDIDGKLDSFIDQIKGLLIPDIREEINSRQHPTISLTTVPSALAQKIKAAAIIKYPYLDERGKFPLVAGADSLVFYFEQVEKKLQKCKRATC
jgi:hypothetical protein